MNASDPLPVIPYQSLNLRLTPIERKVLKDYQEYRFSPPTLARLLCKAAPNLLAFTAFWGLGVGGILWTVHRYLGTLVIGVTLGALIVEIASYRQFLRLWRVLYLIMNWERIADLLDADADEKAQEVNESSACPLCPLCGCEIEPNMERCPACAGPVS